MDARPVGMFDSGIGGLSVLQAFQRLAPHENAIYFADTLYFPYGPRPTAEVRKRAFAITDRLLAADAKLVVVACNTASAAALEDLRGAFSVPFVGMVPGLKPAAATSRSRHVVVLATPGTLDGALLSRVRDEFGAGARVATVPGHGLAELVEAGRTGTAEARSAVRSALQHEVASGADTVVLGCTHYHFLAADITAEFPQVAIIDTTEPVARRAVQLLDELDLRTPGESAGSLSIIVSGSRPAFREAMGRLGFAPSPQEAPV
ncbi:MAG: glutamate racemase [Dehalococcoidia bacterium]